MLVECFMTNIISMSRCEMPHLAHLFLTSYTADVPEIEDLLSVKEVCRRLLSTIFASEKDIGFQIAPVQLIGPCRKQNRS